MGRLANLIRAAASVLRAVAGWKKGDGSIANDLNEVADKLDPQDEGNGNG